MGAAGPSSGFGDDGDAGAMSDINVTPLVDVVLVLLIMFMLIVPAVLATSRIKVDLPETSSVVAVPEKMPLVFTLREENGEVVVYLNDKRTDEDAIRDLIQNLSVPVDEQQSSLSADRGIAYGEVVRIVDLLKSLGITKLSLDTRHVDHK